MSSRSNWMTAALSTGVLALMLGGLFATYSLARPGEGLHELAHRRHHSAALSADDARERALRGIEFLSRWLDLSDAQQDEARAIALRAADDLYALASPHRAQRSRLAELLTAESVDRAALADLRSEGLAMADEASGTLVDALADLAEVLTPEQRRALADDIARFHR